MTDLAGQVAVVTGGGRGIGRETALHLAKAGARVAVTARTGSQLASTVEAIREAGGTAVACPMDVLEEASVRRGFRTIEEELGPVDLLVNNAGISGPEGPLWEVPPDDWWRVLEVNLRGVLYCCQAVLPGMLERNAGRIINVASNAGVKPWPQASAYSTSKAALIRFSDNLAASVEETGLAVFAISPGLVDTEMTRNIAELQEIPADQWTPIGRAAELCVYLAGGEADVLSGRYLHARSDDVPDLVKRVAEVLERDTHTLGLR